MAVSELAVGYFTRTLNLLPRQNAKGVDQTESSPQSNHFWIVPPEAVQRPALAREFETTTGLFGGFAPQQHHACVSAHRKLTTDHHARDPETSL